MQQEYYPFPNREASFRILERDPCFHKIRSEDVPAVFDDAWQTGEAQADQFFQTTSPVSMEQHLIGLGIQVTTIDQDYVLGDMRYFCDYVSEKNIVTIYRKSTELWAEQNGMSYENALDLILAHEYFHYLEWHRIGMTSKHYLVPMLKIGRLELGRTGISALSEIAANAFANRWYTSRISSVPKSPSPRPCDP